MYNSGIFYDDKKLIEELNDSERKKWLEQLDKEKLINIINDLCLTISLYQSIEDETEDEIEKIYKPNM